MEKDKLLRKLMRIRSRLESAFDDAIFEIEELESALRKTEDVTNTPDGADQ